ncbi:nitrogenase component 1 [Thermosulfuriphilus sp.]
MTLARGVFTEKRLHRDYVSTTNACKLCMPLGATLAFRGIEGAVPFLHGSQGCATYMRRYIISHFREPMDIASSSLGEKHAVYGGGPNLKLGIMNVANKYQAKLIGIASTCLTETIGDDVPMILKEFQRETGLCFDGRRAPYIVFAATPSYSGTHKDGFLAATKALIKGICRPEAPSGPEVGIFPGLVSPADIRHLKDILSDFGLSGIVIPDISDPLDAPATDDYQKIPPGGTPLSAIESLAKARAFLELGRMVSGERSPGSILKEGFGVRLYSLGLTIGLRETDTFFKALSEISGSPIPRRYVLERGRLVDAMVDAHKYLFGQKVVIYGEEDLVIGLTSFLVELGAKPVICATGDCNRGFAEKIQTLTTGLLPEPPRVITGVDFYELAAVCEDHPPDILIGNSKGYHLARRLGIPLIRVGFPIHDRLGAQRILHLGYRGALELLDRLVNTIIGLRQESSAVGYTYI